MEQVTNIHTGYIHKLISTVAENFAEMFWEFEISFIPLIIGGTSILIMVCKQSLIIGIVCIIISALAVYSKYKMIKNKHIYQKQANDAESKYNATFVDFIQNIMAVRKLNILNFCNDKIEESSEEYLKATKINERKRSKANGVFTGLMDLLYIVVNTMVGERGIKLSAGQRQRLNLIRGILIDKELYFFDEPTSNLDHISEEKITNMINKYLKDKTCVIVTHRPKLKELCNKHYIFENHIMKEMIEVCLH